MTGNPPEALKSTAALPQVTHARGSYLWDATGKQYIDGSGGPAVYCLGHAHPEVNAAVAPRWPTSPMATATISRPRHWRI